MGMYTEIVIGVELKKDTPQEAINILKRLTGDREFDNMESKSGNPFFLCDRWAIILLCDSYYFASKQHSELVFDDISRAYHLTARANLKNYDNEIKQFCYWLAPFVESEDLAGYYRYEEDERPTLIYFKGGQPIFVEPHEE